MKIEITVDQGEALVTLLKSEKIGLTGRVGLNARQLVKLIAGLTDGAIDVDEAQKDFLRMIDAKVARAFDVEELVGPIFDQVRK